MEQKMKILFLNAYFLPEVISFTHLEQDLIQGLVDAGHEIEIVCPTPTRGIDKETRAAYKEKKSELLFDGKVHVTRFFAPDEGRNPIARALRYSWCTMRERAIGKKMRDADLVFAVSTPPTQGKMAGEVAKALGCPFLYSLQDIFPDSLVTTGLAKEGSFLWRRGKKIADRTYKLADKIVVISDSFVENLKAKGVPGEKIVKIPNWTDTDTIRPIPKSENKLFEELGISRDKFTVVYAGNLGEAQGADVIVRAAELLRDNEEIQFVIFGGGSRYSAVCEKIQELGLKNTIINPLLPQDRVSEVYSLGDVALVTCKAGVGGSGMPSKTWSIMACNTPIIASFDTNSELADILEKANAGISTEPGDAAALAHAIIDASESKIISCGREYVISNASRNACVSAYIDLIEQLAKGRSENREETINS